MFADILILFKKFLLTKYTLPTAFVEQVNEGTDDSMALFCF